MYVIEGERLPIKVWGPPPDEDTLTQTRALANLPHAVGWVALMADAHVGYGMPIGGVLATEGTVIPHAVGLDIGCGVRAWRTGVSVRDFLAKRDQVLSDVQRSVPTGFEWNRAAQDDELFDRAPDVPVLRAELDKARMQLGSLGSGNHFLEVQRDPDDIVWAMIHSGSRNLGKQMAEHFDRIARDLNDRLPVEEEAPRDLAYLPVDSENGRRYLDVMRFCLDFAYANRSHMMTAFKRPFERLFPDAEPGDFIDIHHNYAAEETHLGRQVVIHRKGAVRAVGTVLIPGSMGSHSYLCRGLANPQSFESCSHGAGRALGRKEAKRVIPVQSVIEDMRARDIRLFKPKKSDVAEEAREAYKDIDVVMDSQRDLVEPILRLTPMGVVKA